MIGGAQDGRLPNVLLIGAQKAGTTALHQLLSGHPDVFASADKEPHFFSHNHGRPRHLDDYRAHFRAAGSARVVMESSTTYTMFPGSLDTATRIRETLGDIRLIYLLRDPIDRMRAAYVQALSAGVETRSIGDALLQDTRYLYPSLYALQLGRYLQHFPAERILCLRQEDLRAQPQATLDRVLAFLDLDPGWHPPDLGRAHNVSAGKRAPRWGARALGGRMVQGRLRWARPVVRRLPVDAAWASRPIDERDTTIPADVLDALLVLVRRDLGELRGLLGDGWDWGHLGGGVPHQPPARAEGDAPR